MTRGRKIGMYKKMLVPVDGAKLGEVVFPFAKELAGRLQVATTFLHVSKPEENQLAMSTHGRSGITRWVYGSVAERVLVGASSPILLVRPR